MKISHLSGGVLLVALTLGATSRAFAYACPQDLPPARTEAHRGFLGRVHELNGRELPYRLFVPKDYDAAKAYPLVLYLHHAGLAGDHPNNNDTGLVACSGGEGSGGAAGAAAGGSAGMAGANGGVAGGHGRLGGGSR